MMARKRPQLIPIEDSVLDRVIGRGRGDSGGRPLKWRVHTSKSAEIERGDRARKESGRPDISTLRVFAVMLWMWGMANPAT